MTFLFLASHMDSLGMGKSMDVCWRVHVWKKDNHIIIVGSI